jgi:hypothetical protein
VAGTELEAAVGETIAGAGMPPQADRSRPARRQDRARGLRFMRVPSHSTMIDDGEYYHRTREILDFRF